MVIYILFKSHFEESSIVSWACANEGGVGMERVSRNKQTSLGRCSLCMRHCLLNLLSYYCH